VEFHVSVGDLESHAHVHGEQINVSVRKHHAFRIGAGATGVKQSATAFFVDGRNVALRGTAAASNAS